MLRNRTLFSRFWKLEYGSLPKTSNTLNIRTPKNIAKSNSKCSLKSRTVANFQKLNFYNSEQCLFSPKKIIFSYFLSIFITVKTCRNTVSQYI